MTEARRATAARTRKLLQSAAVLHQRGHYKRAESTYRRALKIAEHDAASNSPRLCDLLNGYGALLTDEGRFAEAGQVYQRSLMIAEKAHGPDGKRVAAIYQDLASLEHAAGNFLRAESFARHALKIRRKTLGADHPDLAHDLAALAPILDGRRRFADAARLYRRALPILERRYGLDHPDVTIALNNLAANAQARGRPAEAERLYRRTLAGKERLFGRDHPSVAMTLNNLAVLQKQRKKYPDADASFRRALGIFENALGSDHPNVAACLDNYAQLLRRMRRTLYAKQLEARARRIRGGLETFANENIAVTATINPLFAQFALTVKPSPIHRWGVYAEEPITARREVIEYAGEVVGHNEMLRRSRRDKVYFYERAGGTYIDGGVGGSGAELVNHSCDPNVVARSRGKRLWFVSVRPIRVGEELTVDYNFRKGPKPIACRCGSPKCRGTIDRI